MTDPNQTESGQEQASQEIPIPKLENASAASQPSGVDIDALADKVANRLRPDFEKVAQSTKDKRIAALEKKLRIGDLAELEEQGVTIPENVKTEYRFRQLEEAQRVPSSVQAPASPGNGAALTAQDVQEVIKSNNLDANDAEVLEKLRGSYRSRDHFEATMTRLALTRATQTTPSPAAATTLQTQASSPKMTDADADGRYAELRTLYRSPTVNAKKIASIKKELTDAGLPVE